MPELPEVEITRLVIASFLEGKRVDRVVIRNAGLRLPVSAEIVTELPGQTIIRVERRAKYLLLRTGAGCVILHLGMSGSLELVPAASPPGKHDHLDIVLENGSVLRFSDPRRFGLALWTGDDPLRHHLLKELGPEPLEGYFTGEELFRISRNRTLTVKEFIMDGRVVAGVGNIYANEALFRAGIRPARPVGRISLARYRRLAGAIKEVLGRAIASGARALAGSPGSAERPAYFPLETEIYGRGGEPCARCGALIKQSRLGGRSTYSCGRCQR